MPAPVMLSAAPVHPGEASRSTADAPSASAAAVSPNRAASFQNAALDIEKAAPRSGTAIRLVANKTLAKSAYPAICRAAAPEASRRRRLERARGSRKRPIARVQRTGEER